jgi:hypothetical protein
LAPLSPRLENTDIKRAWPAPGEMSMSLKNIPAPNRVMEDVRSESSLFSLNDDKGLREIAIRVNVA